MKPERIPPYAKELDAYTAAQLALLKHKINMRHTKVYYAGGKYEVVAKTDSEFGKIIQIRKVALDSQPEPVKYKQKVMIACAKEAKNKKFGSRKALREWFKACLKAGGPEKMGGGTAGA